jgi:hypothetical protein
MEHETKKLTLALSTILSILVIILKTSPRIKNLEMTSVEEEMIIAVASAKLYTWTTKKETGGEWFQFKRGTLTMAVVKPSSLLHLTLRRDTSLLLNILVGHNHPVMRGDDPFSFSFKSWNRGDIGDFKGGQHYSIKFYKDEDANLFEHLWKTSAEIKPSENARVVTKHAKVVLVPSPRKMSPTSPMFQKFFLGIPMEEDKQEPSPRKVPPSPRLQKLIAGMLDASLIDLPPYESSEEGGSNANGKADDGNGDGDDDDDIDDEYYSG